MNVLSRIQQQLKDASSRLEEAVAVQNPDEFVKDATVQRFEFTFDLYWKALKKILQSQGIDIIGWPKMALKAWNKYGLVENVAYMIDLLDHRNMFSHEYDEEKVEERIELITKTISIFFEHITVLIDYTYDPA